MPALTVRQEGCEVLLLSDGRLIARLPWGAAEALWKAIRAQAQRAEEVAQAQRIIFDQAVLLRAGAHLGLTNHPDLQAAALHESWWNRTLRRYLRSSSGIPSSERMGTPALIQHAPKGFS